MRGFRNLGIAKEGDEFGPKKKEIGLGYPRDIKSQSDTILQIKIINILLWASINSDSKFGKLHQIHLKLFFFSNYHYFGKVFTYEYTLRSNFIDSPTSPPRSTFIWDILKLRIR